MVVRFPSASDGSGPEGSGAKPTVGRLAPVTYLPGAEPTARAASVLDRVNAMGREDVASRAKSTPGTRSQARASNVSLHQLARRGMSRWELEQVLERRGVPAGSAQAELDRLERVGLLDDAALAVTLVYTQHTRKGLGRTAIAQELRRRHIDQDVIDDALSELADEDELERATELALKRSGQLSAVDDVTAERRLNGFLVRKGYSGDIVHAAVVAAMRERPRRSAPSRES